jgi:hypothetical protein
MMLLYSETVNILFGFHQITEGLPFELFETELIILLPIFQLLKEWLADDNLEGPKVTRGRSFTVLNRPDTQQNRGSQFVH